MKRLFLIAAIILSGLASTLVGLPVKNSRLPTFDIGRDGQITASAEENTSVAVSRVIDGDTIEIEGGAVVRYIGVDAPELHDVRPQGECFGREAKDANKALVEGQLVRLEKDVSDADRYGRLLRYVYVGGSMVNEKLVQTGVARAATVPPDVRYAERFVGAEQTAREQNLGLWAGCPHM